MERYHYPDLVQALEDALKVMESAGAHIVRDIDFPDWDLDTSKREDMPGNVFFREGSLAHSAPTMSSSESNIVQDWNRTSKAS